jgi:hypothetical protein
LAALAIQQGELMTIKGVLWRFGLLYAAAMLAAGYILGLIGIRGGTGINIVVLTCCVLWVCSEFGKENKRYFSGPEKAVICIGLLVIDLGIQLVVMLTSMPQSTTSTDSSALLFIVSVVGTLHAIAIYFFVSMTKKQLIKQGVING